MTRVALRTGAPLGRRVSCALVEPSEVRMDAAEVQRVLVEPGLMLPRIAVAVVRGEGIGGGGLLLLPSGESAWLPAEALVEADEPNSCCVMRPVDALAVRISACWLACEPPDDPAWTVDRFDAEYVYLQLEGGGSLFRALPEDVHGLDGEVPWCDIAASPTVDTSQPAATAEAWATFIERLLGDGADGLSIRGAERWTADIPGPHIEPGLVDPADSADPADPASPAEALAESVASEAQVGPVASEIRRVVEYRDRLVETIPAQPTHARAPSHADAPTRAHGTPEASPIVAKPTERASTTPRDASGAPPQTTAPEPMWATEVDPSDPTRRVPASRVAPGRTLVSSASAPTGVEARPRADATEPVMPRLAAPPAARLAPILPASSAPESPQGAPFVVPPPPRPQARKMALADDGEVSVAARDQARIDPPARPANAATPAPPMIRVVRLTAPGDEPTTPARTHRRAERERPEPPPPRSEPPVADIEYRAGATSVEIGTIEVRLGAVRREGARQTEPANAPITRATTRTGSLLAEIPRNRTWKGLL
jgi:hypothetical protein